MNPGLSVCLDKGLCAPDLRPLWGGFYHDGRFATLNEVVDHYDGHFKLSLSTEEKRKPHRVSEILVIASQGCRVRGLPPRLGPHHRSSNFSVRFKADGLAGLADRSSRPQRLRQPTSLAVVDLVIALRTCVALRRQLLYARRHASASFVRGLSSAESLALLRLSTRIFPREKDWPRCSVSVPGGEMFPMRVASCGRSRRHGAVTRLLRGGHYTTRGDFLKAGVGNGHARRFRDLFDDAGRSPGRREQPEKSMGVAPVRIHHRVGLQRRPTAASVGSSNSSPERANRSLLAPAKKLEKAPGEAETGSADAPSSDVCPPELGSKTR